MVWVRAVLVWLVLVGVESAHGTARMLLLVPVVGDLRARQISFFTGCLLILAVSWLLVRWLDARTRGRLLLVGCLWAAMTLAFEVAVGRWVLGYSWDRVSSDFNPRRGGLMSLGLVLLIAAPLIAARVRRVPPFAADLARAGDR